jgi:hypothetical protein
MAGVAGPRGQQHPSSSPDRTKANVAGSGYATPEGVWFRMRIKGVAMSRQVFCPECREDFRASSIFVERPNLQHCPYCGAWLDATEEPSADQTLLEPGYGPAPLSPPPVHRAA